MKKYSSFLLTFYCALFLISCTETPERYFDVAVLNSNLIVGFANKSLSRELETPSASMGKDGEVVPSARKEAIDNKISFCKKVLSDIKGLPKTSDASDITNSAILLYEFVIPVYEKDYTQLAAMYDSGLSAEKIKAFDENIKDKYAGQFELLYNDLITKGKLYAAKHNIKVNWAM